ncbi:hypothetical protein PEC18_35660 [Paucibacter sp. O1-1]|nr:hypothetical protein [Paucibacter sp. O1-1]MDA3830997.1 hypothetical protein [Paucibacter sp. O1-1]
MPEAVSKYVDFKGMLNSAGRLAETGCATGIRLAAGGARATCNN